MSYGGKIRASFGSPSYPSPLDRIRTGKRERAAQFGLDPSFEESFEANQSFPKAVRGKLKEENTVDVRRKLEDFKGTMINLQHCQANERSIVDEKKCTSENSQLISFIKYSSL